MAASGFNDTLKWTFGLINCGGKYLTAEAFQGKVTANGTSLRKKQIWLLERVDHMVVALKAHTGRYLSTDKDGNLDASGESIGPDQRYELINHDDGKVAIKSATHERYVGGTGDKLTGYDLEISNTNLFTIQLAIHPQVNLRSINRSTYCHLEDGEIRCDEVIPWGFDSMMVLEFHSGKYALRAPDKRYLDRRGALVDVVSDDTLYTLEFRDAQVALKDIYGKYLTAVGAAAVVQTRKNTIGKDELFALEDSHPQVRLTACNGKYVSIRDSQEVRANQSDFADTELFQMEAIDRADRSGAVKWAFHANSRKYWNIEATVIANKDDFSLATSQFEVEWMGPLVALRAPNGKYISVKPNGKMSPTSSEITDECRFVLEFLNRPLLILRCETGFIGAKGASMILECNRSQYDVFEMTCSAGTYQFRGENGKYVKVDQDGKLSVNSDKPEDFLIELRAHTHLCLVAPNGQYVKWGQTGGFTATGGSTVNNSVLFEY